MRLIFVFIFLPLSFVFSQQLSTVFNNDFSKWKYDDLNFSTVFIKNNNQWRCNQTRIKTVFNNDWNSWRLDGQVEIKTAFRNDFNSWEIKTPSGTIRLRTRFKNDFNSWEFSGLFDGDASTVFHNNKQRWNINFDDNEISEESKAAILFVLILNSFLLE